MNAAERDRALQFAHERVAVPWRRMVDAAKKVAGGKKLTAEEARLELPLVPVTADARVLYPLMRDFVGLLTWQPNNLFTIILEDDGKSVCRAYLELTQDNNFVEMLDLEPDDPMLQKAVELLNTDRASELRWMLDEACQQRFNERANWVKVAKLSFFAAYADAWRVWEETGDLWAWVKAALAATQRVYAEKLIMFGHEPPLFARVRELMSGILRVDPEHLDLQRLFGPLPNPTDHPVVFALTGQDYTIALKLGGQDPLHITVDRETTEVVEGLPLNEQARGLYKMLAAKQVFVMRTEPVASIVYEAVRPELPWARDDLRLVVQRSMELAKGFGRYWHMFPLPFYLKDWVRRPLRWLGLPYDLNNLAAWFLPTVFVEGAELFLGQHSNRTFVFLDGDEPVMVLVVEMYRGGLRRIQTVDPRQFRNLFAGREKSFEATKEGVTEVSLRLWEQGYGFQNLTTALRLSTMRAMGDFLSIRRYAYLYRLLSLPTPLIRLARELRRGGIATHPDRMLVELERWVKKVGRPRIYRTLLNMSFDRKPRTRGLLYVKETIIAAVVVAAVVAAVVLL